MSVSNAKETHGGFYLVKSLQLLSHGPKPTPRETLNSSAEE